jgi:hypothetical protein
MVKTDGTVALDGIAAVSERPVTHDSGKKMVLVFHGPKTQTAPKEVGKCVRAKHPFASDVLVVNVVNLKAMGGMWKKVANAQITSTYNKLAEKIGNGAQEYVIMLTDWENEIGPAFGIENSDKMPAVVVLGKDGAILAGHEGKDGLVEAALAALA